MKPIWNPQDLFAGRFNPDTLSPIDRILWRHGHFIADRERHRKRGTLLFCRQCRTEHRWTETEKRHGCRTAGAWYEWHYEDLVREANLWDWEFRLEASRPAEYHIRCECGHFEIQGDTLPRRECRVCSEIREER